MAINNDRSLLEQQILSNSGLKGKELENLKARLAVLSEQQLQAELSKLLSGNNKGEWYTGVTVEHNESDTAQNSPNQTTFTDDDGNEISESTNGDEVLERTIKSTDTEGNVYETTVTFSDGRPVTQTKSKNGNTTETTTYKYNDEEFVPYVTVQTERADKSKVITNVLETDENGNYTDEDFIDRQTTAMDGTTTHIFTENNCVIEQQLTPSGKKVDTIYKGDRVEDYDNKKLNRVYQRTELQGEVHEVAYDGNGNTITVVQNGESPSAIAKKFGVKESSLLKLNPARGKNSITQVGADIVVPGEFDADTDVIAARKTKQGAIKDFSKDEVQRIAERLYSSTIQEVTLDKDYKDVYEYARALLTADGVENPSNQQVNIKANEILVANANIELKKGTKVLIATKRADSKYVQELSNNGFKPTRENAVFYYRFNALNPTQQQKVLSVIKYCKSQNITDSDKIKAKILETFPEINLFDSGKLISMDSSNAQAYQRKKPVSLETFLTETLKLDLKSDLGRQVYERLSSFPQEELDKINGSNFGDLSGYNFKDIANKFESNGVNIRTMTENQIELNSRTHREEKLGIPQQRFTSEMLANIYDSAADMLEQYYNNHGVLDFGTYLEGVKNIMDLITPDSILGMDMRSTMHLASDYRKAAQRFRQMHTDNPETFKKEYAELQKDGLVTADYNEQNVQKFMSLIESGKADINSDEYKNVCEKAFGFKGIENTEKYIEAGQTAGGIGDIAVMLYTLGAASELKVMGKATQGVYGALERGAGKIMGKTTAQKTAKIGTSMLMGGTTLGGFTLGKETLNNLSNPMRDAASWETWKETGIASAESFGFGAFGGLLNETVVAPLVKAIEKPAEKATQAVSKALTEQGELTGKQIMQTVSNSGSLKLDGIFKMNSQELGNLARSVTAKGVGFGVEVAGFTAYEAAVDVVKDIIDPSTGRLPETMTDESLTEYLGEKLGEQFSNLGTIKGISQLMMMTKGGKVAQKAMMNEILSKSDVLKDIKFKKAEINGREVYEVTYPNGNREVVTSLEKAMATCQMAMQMEFLVKSLMENPKDTMDTSDFKPETAEAPKTGVKPEGVEENPILIRLETVNDREGFSAIRDEIKKMPNGEEKTQLMQAYLKKYNEWSADSSRPDIRMEYKPDDQAAPKAPEFKELTDEEFAELKPQIEAKLKEKNIEGVALNKNNIQLADMIFSDEKLYNNENVMQNIVQILYMTNTPESAKVKAEVINLYTSNEKLYNNENVMKNIGGIIRNTNTPERVEIAKTILSDENLYNNENVMQNIGNIIKEVKSDNFPLAKQIFQTEGLNPEKTIGILESVKLTDGVNAGQTDTQKVKQYTSLLQDKKLSPFVVEHLNDGMDMNTVAFLAKTQKKINTENAPQQSKPQLEEELQNSHNVFTSHGMGDKEATAIVKAISQDGVPDIALQSVALDLLNKGIAANKIGDVIRNAKITGEFNQKIVDDFVALQNLGLNPLLEKNLATLNNISGADTAVKFNSGVKKQIKAMLERLTPEQSQALSERGFNIDEINKKLDTKIVRTSDNVPNKAKVVSGLRTKQSITGFEKVVVDKYNPDQKIWQNEQATRAWAEEKYNSIIGRDYKSTTYKDANEPRERGLKEWADFMANEPELKDNPFAKIILAEFITKDLLPENADIPPQLDKNLVKEILTKADEKTNFSKLYAEKIREKALKSSQAKEVEVNGVKGTWYTVPQTDKSSADYKTNVDKVKAFSDGTNWCIRTYNAEPYVEQGAMHFFVDENGLTQVCIRETAPGSVYEIQKRQQNATVPIAHIDVIDDYMTRNGLKAQPNCQAKIETAKQAKPEFDKLKAEFTELAKNKDYKSILEKIGITVKENPDGTLVLSHYDPEMNGFTLSDLGIKENDLLENVVKIEGDAKFKNSNATALQRLQEVGGKLEFEDSSLSDVRSLKSINGKEINWQKPELPLNTPAKSMVLRSGDNVHLKPELERQVRDIATQIRKSALDIENDIVKFMKECGFEVSDSKMSHRAKGSQSLYDKLKNYLIDEKNADKTLNDAIKSVKDAVGTRTVLKNKDYTQHPEVAALLNAGKRQEAVLRAAELQSQEMVENLKAFLIKQKENNTEIRATRVNNYMANDGVPYLSERQLAELQDLGVVSVKSRITPNDEKAGLIDFDNKDATTKVRESGYTAYQMNFVTKDGFVYEWQFRGEEVNRFAEGEHIPYDLRTNKDITGGNKDLELLYQPIKNLLNENTMKEDVFNVYNKYLTAHYNYLREKELGFDTKKPNMEDFGNFDTRLRAENLEILHDIASDLKDGKISADGAVKKYESCII